MEGGSPYTAAKINDTKDLLEYQARKQRKCMMNFNFMLVYNVADQCFIIKHLRAAICKNDSAQVKSVLWHIFLFKFEDFKTRLSYLEINIQ